MRLIERAAFPRHRPGETPHPGLESIFQQLGILNDVVRASTLRHCSHTIFRENATSSLRLARTRVELGTGYQIEREKLDALLITKAREMGVEVMQPRFAGEPIIHNGCMGGIRGNPDTCARHVIDATGSRGWLRRHIKLPATRIRRSSPTSDH